MALRLLTLHGFGQNAAVFMEKRAKELTRKLRTTVTLHAIDAPHILPYDETLRGWWIYPPDLWDGRADTIQALAEGLLKRETFDPIGLSESFELVLAEWSKGGYDGVLGFSQGAILAAALCAELHRRGPASGVPMPRFAIFISGFGRPVPQGVEAYPPKSPLPVPSLHIWGAADDHIPGWASESLAAYFEQPKLYTHPGHHFVPQKAADIAVILEFLTPFLSKDGSLNGKASAASKEQQKPRQGQSLPSVPVASSQPKVLPMCATDELGGAMKYYCLFPGMTPALGLQVASPPAGAAQGAQPAAASPPCNGQVAAAAAVPAQPQAASQACTGSVAAGYLEEELTPPGPATYERLAALLRQAGVAFEQLGPHEPCRTSEDSVRVRLAGGWKGVTLNSGAKAMLLRAAGSEEKWLLAVLPADRKLSWKRVRALRGKATRMATEEEVARVTGCIPGAVPPFGAAFPAAVECLADSNLPSIMNFNCGLRTRSMQISRADYERVQQPLIVDIAE